MDLYAVMTEVDTRLRAIPGIRTTSIGADTAVTPPAAVQYLPDRLDFDLTYGRGMDKATDLIVVVFIGRQSLRSAVSALAPYVAGSGTRSVKAALDSSTAAYASCSDFQVLYAEIDYSARLAGTDYLAALFHCNFAGSGA